MATPDTKEKSRQIENDSMEEVEDDRKKITEDKQTPDKERPIHEPNDGKGNLIMHDLRVFDRFQISDSQCPRLSVFPTGYIKN